MLSGISESQAKARSIRSITAGDGAAGRSGAGPLPGASTAPASCIQSRPPVLADELTRSWAGQWPALPKAMDEAANYVAPTTDELALLAVPLGVAAATDDPVHPVEVALEWVAAAPRAALRTVTLDEIGADPAALGTACVTALLEL